MKRLNGMDAMLLCSETPNLYTHTLKVAAVDVAHYDGEFTNTAASAASARSVAIPACRLLTEPTPEQGRAFDLIEATIPLTIAV